jgi:hypothetical protein
MDFKEVYQPPIKMDEYGMYGICANGTKALTAFSDDARKELVRIVGLLNGNGEKYKKEDIFVDKGAKLMVKGHLIIVRGWGRLIGFGGLGLSVKEATKIQDDFINWVVETITE